MQRFSYFSYFLVSFLVKLISGGGYIIRKINTLLIPFILYYILSYLLFYCLKICAPGLLESYASQCNGFQDVIVQRQLFNGPIWFLLSLFEVELLYYFIFKYIEIASFRLLICFLLSLVGLYFSYVKIDLPLWIDTSLIALFFFCLGDILCKYNVFEQKIFSRKNSLLWMLVFYLVYLLLPCNVSMSINRYSSGILLYISGTSIVLSILFFSKFVNKDFLISWMGKNTLVILCTHHLLYRPIKYFCDVPIVVLIITMIIEYGIIVLLNKYCPYLSGKYQFIKIG